MTAPERDADWLPRSLDSFAQMQADIRRVRRNGYRVDLVLGRGKQGPSGAETRELIDIIVYEPAPDEEQA